jgi:sugar phosphate isomerase/epimerase
MKLSFTTLGCPNWTLEQIAQNAKALGYDGVELRTNSDGNHLSSEATTDDAAKIGRMFKDQGVPVASLMGYCRFAFTDKAEVAKNQALMRRLLPLAEAIGAKYIRTFAGHDKGLNNTEAVEVVGAALAPLAAEAAQRGIKIGLETHDAWCSGKQVMQLVERVGNANGFGIVYDIFNAYTTGLESWDVTYQTVKNHIAYCHVKDGYKNKDGKYVYVMPGAGELPMGEIVQTLVRDGYQGFFSFEWEKKWHPELEEPERAFPQFPVRMRTWERSAKR